VHDPYLLSREYEKEPQKKCEKRQKHPMSKKDISSSPEIKKVLHRSGLKARKELGQHFLTDKSIVDTILSAAELSPSDFIIEVGPGLGILTSELARRVQKVTAIELDTKLAAQLKKNLSSSPNITIINADILKVDLSKVLGDKSSYKVVANIPYYITSLILQFFMEASLKPSLLVVMVQKEVGDAIAAGPGKMSMLAISIQVYCKPRIICYVSSQSFYPQPKVDSAVIRLDMLPMPAVKVADIRNFLNFVKCGFRSPRKQLRNSLAQGLNTKPADIMPLLTESNIDPQRRPETLTIQEWQRLYDVVTTSEKVQLPC
jgi:16S rRNA (adenine1518-N6/adenine1519-N6)-dimethyltransferase